LNSGPAVGTPAAENQNQGIPKENSEMKLLRCLFALTLVCALSGIAKADPFDFHMVVVDPPTPDNPTFTVTDIQTSPVTVSFTNTCAIDGSGLPTYDGCAAFINGTGAPLTTLELVMPNSGLSAGQTPNCTQPSGIGTDFFSSGSCPTPGPGQNYVIDFTDGSIPINTYFVIAETGVPTDDTPWTGTLSTTPEPSSMWLMSTGAVMLGAFLYSRRRNGLGWMGL
jgi:hypothetical protein